MTRNLILLMASLLLVGGCASTPKVVESWKDPSFTGPLKFKKILVIASHPEQYARHSAEDELVQQIGPDRAMRGDQLLTDADRKDRETIKAKAKQAGVDGVITLRLDGATTHSRAGGGGDSMWHDPDRNVMPDNSSYSASYSQRVILIRTRIYSVADDKLIWEGVSESFDPKDAQSLIADVAKAVGKRLREEHLIE